MLSSEKIEVSGLVEGDSVASWKSVNTNIATVDSDGVITAVREGETVVTVTLLSGRFAEIPVTVTGPTITLSTEEVNLPVLSSETIEVTGLVPNDGVASWYSSSTWVAEVDENGTITAKNAGETYVRVTLISGLRKDIPVTVTGPTITLSKEEVTLPVLSSETIEVSGLVPNDGVASWTSGGSAAEVDENGTITGKRAGSTYVCVTLISGLRKDIPVTVTGPTITLSKDQVTLTMFQTETIEVSGLVPNDKVTRWESGNVNVATVSEDGLISPVGPGSTTVRVYLESGLSASVSVRVSQPTGKLNVTYLELSPDDTEQLTVTDMIEGDSVDSWRSLNPNVASVDEDGNVTAVSTGVTSVEATLKSGLVLRASIRVAQQSVIVIENGNISLEPFQTEQIRITGDTIASCVSNKPDIASVSDSGLVTAKKIGSAQITVTLRGGIRGTVRVTVTSPTGVKASFKNGGTIAVNGTDQIVVEGLNSEDNVVSYTSGDTSVASVNSTGLVTGKKAGSANIKLETLSGLTMYVKVTVKGGEEIRFIDVNDPSQFYYDAVYWAVDKGITTGYADNTFRPNSNCNRAAVVTFLWRLAGKPDMGVTTAFKDMTGNSDFDHAITWASKKGITTGYSDGTFRPWATCNRAAIVTFLWRYAGNPEPKSMASFKDMTGNSDFDKAISWAAENGITTGYSDNTFRPWNQCLRLAIVSFLYRYANL